MHNGARFRLIAILAPLIAITLASFWVVEVMRRTSGEIGDPRARTEPDFYVEKFNYVKMTGTGEAQYYVTGARLTHNPLDDSYDVLSPVVRSLRNEGEPLTITARRGWVNSDSSEIHLWEDVHIDRPATPDRERFQLNSQHLIVLPDDDAMKTNAPVKLSHGESTLFGTGMFADNAAGKFWLHNDVHGTHQPPAR